MARPRSGALSVEIIAQAALDLVDETGDVQMVQLAHRLGVAPSSLYNYVSGRTEVIDLARFHMLRGIEPLARVHDWRDAVCQLLRQLASSYARQPRMLPIIFSSSISEEGTLALYEPLFTSLLEAGFAAEQLRLIAAVIDFQAMGLANGFPPPTITDSIREKFPGYTISVERSAYSSESATEFASQTIVAGLETILSQRSGLKSEG